MNRRIFVVFFIMIPVAALHLVTGPEYRGPFRPFVTGYLIDIALPFAFFFLGGVVENRFFQKRWTRGLGIFFLASAVEVAQYAGYPLFGSTFDPLDIVCYAVGVVLAAMLERFIPSG